MTGTKVFGSVAVVAILAGLAWWLYGPRQPQAWSDADVALIQTLSLKNLPALPPDPSNSVADDPQAAEFGQRLFFDTRLSANGAVSCATCHKPERRFTDGLPKGLGIALSGRNTRSIVGTAYSPWLYWDGRRDSQWAQALSPLEDPAEHGGNRMGYVRLVAGDAFYAQVYESLFGPLPDFSDLERFPESASPASDEVSRSAWIGMAEADRERVNRVFSNLGKAIAAYERRLLPGLSRFDAYAEALSTGDSAKMDRLFGKDEVVGLQLFIGDGRCIECHNGPLLTNNEFHNTGLLSFKGELPDRGRAQGVREVLVNEFNCWSPYSDDPQPSCPELAYVRTGPELIGATRTPSLRNIDGTAPYARKGQQKSLADVLDHYNDAPLAMIGHNEAKPLGLNSQELGQLEAFLNTLAAPLGSGARWLTEPVE